MEIELIQSLNVKEPTKKQYIKHYQKCIEINIHYSEKHNEIIKKLDTLENLEEKLRLLNIIYILRNAFEYPLDEIRRYRHLLFNERRETKSETNRKNEEEGLFTFNEILEHRDGQLTKYNYKGYIITYLLIEYNTRNMDLDLTITKKQPNDDNRNYLWVKKNDVLYIRNAYKTVQNYGDKQHLITNENFFYACTRLLGRNTEKNLLDTTNIAREVARETLGGIGQGRYLKIILEEADKHQIRFIQDNRGSNAGTLLDRYDMGKIFKNKNTVEG